MKDVRITMRLTSELRQRLKAAAHRTGTNGIRVRGPIVDTKEASLKAGAAR